MASEYLKKKYEDVKPDAPRELTEAEKRKNWWDYHKWHIVIGLALLGMFGSILWSALGIGQIDPDYQVAYMGEYALPDSTAAALESQFAALGEDLNGDGRVVVSLQQYPTSSSIDAEAVISSEVQLMADLLECESYFFLLEDPASFQKAYHILCRLDGSLPAEDDLSVENTCLSWEACPVLAGMDLGSYSYALADELLTGDSQTLLSGLFIARRGFWTEKSTAYPEGCAALWDTLTEGAVLS